MRRARTLSILFLTLAAASLLVMGALQARRQYLLRGIPDGLPEPVPHGGARLGVNVDLLAVDPATQVDTLQAIKAHGIDYVKQTVNYRADFDWTATDSLIEAAQVAGVTLVPLLDGDPTQGYAPPSDPMDFAAWAGEFAARYGDRLTYFIIWDEPNLSSHWGGRPANPAEYGALLTAAAGAIRGADPDAVIIAAPLAPTRETGPENLAEHLYLRKLYEAGVADAFDVVASKPYGFDDGPEARRVSADALNFSRAILLREVLTAFGEDRKAVWAGNWGWNVLPPGWEGAPSIWGQTSDEQRAAWTVASLERARREWPWMGVMFLENWAPDAPDDDPRRGFDIAGSRTASALRDYQATLDEAPAAPGFHPASPDDPAQAYRGGWQFSPEFGADIGDSGDSVRFTFWGTDVGLTVRRADYRARLYATIDGRPANALPRDENGAALVLTSSDPTTDYLSIEPVAGNLHPGEHTLEIVALRGWDQWALKGFNVGYRPPDRGYRWALAGLALGGLLFLALAVSQARRAGWGETWANLSTAYGRLSDRLQLLLAGAAAATVTLTGWLTWGQSAEGVYRRLGDGGQLLATATAAAIFYVTPSFILYMLALAALFGLLVLRPAWGLALIALTMPFYVPPLPKPMFGYRFSPVEVFTLITLAAWLAGSFLRWGADAARGEKKPLLSIRSRLLSARLLPADYAVAAFVIVATLSLFFTERVDVATNEWRVVIVEPALFYLLLRAVKPTKPEMWVVVDAFVLSGVIVAGYGLWQYAAGRDLITAEGGLLRLRSVYGSPNNVALYLDRVLPLLAAMALLGGRAANRRRLLYVLALLPIGLALLLTFSKGSLFLGVPAGLAIVFWIWQRQAGRRTWPWLVAAAVAGLVALIVASRIPALAGRLDLFGTTGVFRLNLWRSAVNMVADHPFFGVGLDNFLYAYRGRYIFDAAWQEPNLSHPHNIVLDFATRLGLLGLLAGGWMIFEAGRYLARAVAAPAPRQVGPDWLPVAAGFSGSLAAMLAHGLVDHSFFLVDLSFVFFLILGAAVWLNSPAATQQTDESSPASDDPAKPGLEAN